MYSVIAFVKHKISHLTLGWSEEQFKEQGISYGFETIGTIKILQFYKIRDEWKPWGTPKGQWGQGARAPCKLVRGMCCNSFYFPKLFEMYTW